MTQTRPARIDPFAQRHGLAFAQARSIHSLVVKNSKKPPAIDAAFGSLGRAYSTIRKQARNEMARHFLLYGDKEPGRDEDLMCIGVGRLLLERTIPGTAIGGTIAEYWIGDRAYDVRRNTAAIGALAAAHAIAVKEVDDRGYFIGIGNTSVEGLPYDMTIGRPDHMPVPFDAAEHKAAGLPAPWSEQPTMMYVAVPLGEAGVYTPSRLPGV